MSCKYFHVSNAYTVNDSDSQIVLGFPSTVTVTDKTRFCLKLVFDPSVLNQTYTVLATVNGANVPLWDKYGNPVTVAELSKGKVYRGYYGDTTPHIIFNELPRTYNCGCNNVL